MDDEAAAAQVAREGRLWANLFVYALDAGRFEVRPPRARLQTPPGAPTLRFQHSISQGVIFCPRVAVCMPCALLELPFRL